MTDDLISKQAMINLIEKVIDNETRTHYLAPSIISKRLKEGLK